MMNREKRRNEDRRRYPDNQGGFEPTLWQVQQRKVDDHCQHGRKPVGAGIRGD